MTSAVLRTLLDRPRVLLVEDPRPLRDALAAALRSKGYAVECADTDNQVLDVVRRWKPNLVLVDLSSHDRMGAPVSRFIKRECAIPVMVMAKVGEEERVLSALESGVQDFVMRPIDLEAVTTKVDAVLMSPPTTRRAERQVPETVRVGPVVLYPSRRAVYIRGNGVHLPKLEYDLLFLLVSDPGRVRTREEILCDVWANRTTDTRTLNTHIQRIRTKVELDKSHPRHVMTMRNIGYYFDGGGWSAGESLGLTSPIA